MITLFLEKKNNSVKMNLDLRQQVEWIPIQKRWPCIPRSNSSWIWVNTLAKWSRRQAVSTRVAKRGPRHSPKYHCKIRVVIRKWYLNVNQFLYQPSVIGNTASLYIPKSQYGKSYCTPQNAKFHQTRAQKHMYQD